MVDTDTTAFGWDAIDGALERLYPGVEPMHYGTLIKCSLGGPDPLDGISIYARDDHWHYVSYGMSELYTKDSDNPDESGWGFEFTFRLARDPAEDEPPVWAANFLQNLARYVFNSSNPFAPGHHVDLNGPISLARTDTAIRAVTFTDDPELGVIDTPHGKLRFLQIVGITLDEYAAIERWDAAQLLHTMAPRLPLLITDLARGDLTAEPDIAAAIEDGVRRDGSSTGSLYVAEAGWSTQEAGLAHTPATTLTFGANAAERIGRVLAARLSFGRSLLIDTSESAIGFQSGEQLTVADRGNGFLEIHLPPPVLAELAAALRPTAGTYQLDSAPRLAVQIVKSQIRDNDGNIVYEVG